MESTLTPAPTLRTITPHTADRSAVNIPVNEILCDDTFNCRGRVAPIDVLDLARDIAAKGLDIPIVVRPYSGRPGYKYSIVAGHRRYTAFLVNKYTSIPAIIRTDLGDDLKAASLNLRENLTRKELNIKQEAIGVKKFLLAGWSEAALAEEIHQSRGWVQIRYALLRLPDDIQNEAAAGVLTQHQILKMSSMKNEDAYSFLHKVKKAKLNNEKLDLDKDKPRDSDKPTKKVQERGVIFSLIDSLLQMTKSGLHTRCLAWAAGEISDADLDMDIRMYCAENGHKYIKPQIFQNIQENDEIDT